MAGSLTLVIVTYFIIAVIIITIVLNIIQKKRVTYQKKEVEYLEKEKNLISSTPVLSELSKVEAIAKNEKLEEKYKIWQERFNKIKEVEVAKINEMIIDLDLYIDNKDYKNFNTEMAKTEFELYKTKVTANNLLEEIREITLSEDKYRDIIIKLKSKYRTLFSSFDKNKSDYEDVSEAIELQCENIEQRFNDFEVSMQKNEYTEVVHIVKALDTMIDHMGIVIEEVPNLVLLTAHLIPKRIDEIQANYKNMQENGYALDYLNLEYNIEETVKKVQDNIDRIKVLNLKDCMFELKTILDYLDSLFVDFDKEKICKKSFEDIARDFEIKLKRTNKVVSDLYKQIDDIKKMYDLTDKDLNEIGDIKQQLLDINIVYKDVKVQISDHLTPYSKLVKSIEDLTTKLRVLDDNLDDSLHSLGSMHDDEVRAREQLDEIQEFLKRSKLKIRSYKLPIIINNYFVELQEANESILEIIKELEKKPITIKTLNIRVDTARDLVLKLYNTTNEMIKTAQLAEMAMVYGNKYRSSSKEVDLSLNQAEIMFYKGNYKGALEGSINAIETVEPGIYKKLLVIYDK